MENRNRIAEPLDLSRCARGHLMPGPSTVAECREALDQGVVRLYCILCDEHRNITLTADMRKWLQRLVDLEAGGAGIDAGS